MHNSFEPTPWGLGQTQKKHSVPSTTTSRHASRMCSGGKKRSCRRMCWLFSGNLEHTRENPENIWRSGLHRPCRRRWAGRLMGDAVTGNAWHLKSLMNIWKIPRPRLRHLSTQHLHTTVTLYDHIHLERGPIPSRGNVHGNHLGSEPRCHALKSLVLDQIEDPFQIDREPQRSSKLWVSGSSRHVPRHLWH